MVGFGDYFVKILMQANFSNLGTSYQYLKTTNFLLSLKVLIPSRSSCAVEIPQLIVPKSRKNTHPTNIYHSLWRHVPRASLFPELLRRQSVIQHEWEELCKGEVDAVQVQPVFVMRTDSLLDDR